MIITIDGHAGSGKSSASRLLAAEYGFELLNTGAMYRAVALGLMRAGIDIDAEPRDRDLIAKIISHYDFQLRNNQVILNHEDITEQLYTEEVGKAASRVGTFHEVRDRDARRDPRGEMDVVRYHANSMHKGPSIVRRGTD